ncbi:TPA: hypothetical protein ACH3X1_016563 [Trebouxia sp. C0004]
MEVKKEFMPRVVQNYNKSKHVAATGEPSKVSVFKGKLTPMHLSVRTGYLKDKGVAFNEHAWAVEHFLLNDPKVQQQLFKYLILPAKDLEKEGMPSSANKWTDSTVARANIKQVLNGLGLASIAWHSQEAAIAHAVAVNENSEPYADAAALDTDSIASLGSEFVPDERPSSAQQQQASKRKKGKRKASGSEARPSKMRKKAPIMAPLSATLNLFLGGCNAQQ